MNLDLWPLEKTTSEVFERMFYLFPLQGDSPPPQSALTPWRISLRDQEKTLFLRGVFSPEVAKAMAANYLGLPEEEVTPSLADLTLRETINVLAGNLLSLLAEPFELGIPERPHAEEPSPPLPPLLPGPGIFSPGDHGIILRKTLDRSSPFL